jgi:hypothetical protein
LWVRANSLVTAQRISLLLAEIASDAPTYHLLTVPAVTPSLKLPSEAVKGDDICVVRCEDTVCTVSDTTIPSCNTIPTCCTVRSSVNGAAGQYRRNGAVTSFRVTVVADSVHIT